MSLMATQTRLSLDTLIMSEEHNTPTPHTVVEMMVALSKVFTGPMLRKAYGLGAHLVARFYTPPHPPSPTSSRTLGELQLSIAILCLMMSLSFDLLQHSLESESD